MAPTVLSRANSSHSLRNIYSSSNMSFKRSFKAMPPGRYLSPMEDDSPAITVASNVQTKTSRLSGEQWNSLSSILPHRRLSDFAEQSECHSTCSPNTPTVEADTNPKLRSKRDSAKYLKEKKYLTDPTLSEVVDAERCARCARNGWRCFIEVDPNSPRMVCRPCGKNKCSFGNSKQRPNTKTPPPPTPAIEPIISRKRSAVFADEVDKRAKYEPSPPLSEYSVHAPNFEYQPYPSFSTYDHPPQIVQHTKPHIILPPISSLVDDVPAQPLGRSRLLSPYSNLPATELTTIFPKSDSPSSFPTPPPSSPGRSLQASRSSSRAPSYRESSLDLLAAASEQRSRESSLCPSVPPVRADSEPGNPPSNASSACVGNAPQNCDPAAGHPVPGFPYSAADLADDDLFFNLISAYATHISRPMDRWSVLENLRRWSDLPSPSKRRVHA